MLTVGSLAKHYNTLPSQVIEHGTTYDIMIMDVMAAWERYQNNPTDLENYNMEELEKMVRETR